MRSLLVKLVRDTSVVLLRFRRLQPGVVTQFRRKGGRDIVRKHSLICPQHAVHSQPERTFAERHVAVQQKTFIAIKAQRLADLHRMQAIQTHLHRDIGCQQAPKDLHSFQGFPRCYSTPGSDRKRDSGVAICSTVPGMPRPTRPTSDCEILSVPPDSNVAG